MAYLRIEDKNDGYDYDLRTHDKGVVIGRISLHPRGIDRKGNISYAFLLSFGFLRRSDGELDFNNALNLDDALSKAHGLWIDYIHAQFKARGAASWPT